MPALDTGARKGAPFVDTLTATKTDKIKINVAATERSIFISKLLNMNN